MRERVITTKPMRSRAQWRWAFGTGQSFARRWARATPGGKIKRYRKLPKKVRKKDAPLIALLKANYGAKKGQVIQGRLVRGEGGRFASSGGGGSASAAPRRGKRPPPKTEEQRAAERETKRQARIQERAQQRETNIQSTFDALDMPEDAAASLRGLANGEAVEDDGGLVKMGLAEQAADGSYRLTATGRAVMNAAERGDLGAAKDAKSRAQDKADADAAKKLAEAAVPAGGGGGGGKKKEPPVKLPPRQTSQAPKLAGGGGGGARKPPQATPAQPQTDPALVGLARRLSRGEALAETEAQTLIRNGLARLTKAGLMLTASGSRVVRTKEALLGWLFRRKADTAPSRTLSAGHTGVMVALLPDAAALQALVALPGVTEPADQIHLTLAYLGDSTEQPLATNKARVIEAVKQWASERGAPLRGTINGAGRFFHAERDGTNAVWVAPDVPGLPELRQSLVTAIEAAGFDSSQDHGFTPHITVAYVPKDAPTPAIRIEQPVTFSHATLAWGDEQYDFPLGTVSAKAQRTYGGKKRTALPDTAFAGPDRSFPIMTAQDVRDAVRSLGRTKHDKAAVKRGIIRRARAIGATDALPESWRGKAGPFQPAVPSGPELFLLPPPSFTVYKAADGAPRWIARSTTAYRDRDREILPIATLDADSQRMTATKQYGPLRWWHVGRPDARNPAAPWGPGLDLGWCDFSMQIGRTRVESGTFKDAAIARRIAQHPGAYELSPGFFHAADQPDAGGVFHAIHTFERSLVPIRHGRASNLFTGLTMKEHTPMDAAEQARRLKAAIDELGLSPEQAAALTSGLVATDKAAATTPDPATGQPGVAFKSDDQPPAGVMETLRRWLKADEDAPPAVATTKEANPPAPDPLYAAIAAQQAQLADLTATLKAAMEPPPPEEEMAEGEDVPTEEPSGQTVADLSVEEFVSVISQALAQALAGAMGGISDKVAALDGEMKAMGYTRVKEEQEKADKIAALKAQIDQQQALLKELTDDQPAIPPVRPSHDPANVLGNLNLKDVEKPAFAFDDIAAQLFGRQPTH